MNCGLYKKIKKMCNELKEYRKLREICDCTYQRYILTKKFLGLSNENQSEVALCDSELTNVIREYCDKKINKLEKRLEMLWGELWK